MTKFGMRMAVAAVACSALSLGACWSEETGNAAKKAGEEAVAAVEKAAGEAAESAKETVSEAADTAKEAVSAATETAKETAGEATAAVKEAVDAAATKAAETVEAAKQAAAEASAPEAKEEAAAETPAASETQVAAAEETPAEAEAKKEAAVKDELSHHNEDVKFEDGRYRLEDGTPTYKVTDGVVDWASWEGFRRYHDACHVCHGPNALGGSFAPSLAESLKTMSYEDFVAVVSAGRVANRGGTQYVMPALGGNPDVMCYLDDIYTYVKGRSAFMISNDPKNAIPPGRPVGREDISEEARAQKKECLPE